MEERRTAVYGKCTRERACRLCSALKEGSVSLRGPSVLSALVRAASLMLVGNEKETCMQHHLSGLVYRAVVTLLLYLTPTMAG